MGQTAVGKSALALSLSERFSGEIVTADSRQVYCRMDIGTDKPGSEDLARVPHHMIDVVMPDEPYTLADYQIGAYEVIKEIGARHNVPFLTGGTPLYMNAVIEGWIIPRVAPDLGARATLEQDAAAHGSQYLHTRLLALDPQAAASILPTNTRRLVRALEVIQATGRPISEQQGKSAPPYRILTLHIQCGRDELYRRIDARVEEQLDRGLMREVWDLNRAGYSFSLPSMSSLGYRQIGDYLKGKATLPEAIQRIKWDTHGFARHQNNWFRRLATALRLDATSQTLQDEAAAAVERFLAER